MRRKWRVGNEVVDRLSTERVGGRDTIVPENKVAPTGISSEALLILTTASRGTWKEESFVAPQDLPNQA
jgi:hypothetical protein